MRNNDVQYKYSASFFTERHEFFIYLKINLINNRTYRPPIA